MNGSRRLIQSEPWPGDPPRVRIGLHTGEAVEVDGDYFGPALNVAARFMSAGWGGSVLCSGATVELARGRLAEGVGFRHLGEHRLRDLAQPVVLWQVLAADLAPDHPPPRSLDQAIGNLPATTSSFIGRRAEAATILSDLGEARVVTLRGVGGVGKTKLALEVAAEAQPGAVDGVWLFSHMIRSLTELSPAKVPKPPSGAAMTRWGPTTEANCSIRCATSSIRS